MSFRPELDDRARHKPPDAAETIDCYLGGHPQFLLSPTKHRLAANEAALLSDPASEVYSLAAKWAFPLIYRNRPPFVRRDWEIIAR